MTPQEEFAERIKQLKSKYVDTLIERNERLQPIVESLEAGTATDDMITQARFDIHKIAGSAGSFSFSELGSCAVDANTHIDAGEAGSAQSITALRTLMEHLAKAIADARAMADV